MSLEKKAHNKQALLTEQEKEPSKLTHTIRTAKNSSSESKDQFLL